MKTGHLPGEFTCLRCGVIVSEAFELSGVRNRNHCPYCLWSRHLDWRTPGDRISSCKRAMRPIGLALKNSRNKYAALPAGELMVVHQCTACAKVSINRIAADDGADNLAGLFADSLQLSPQIHAALDRSGIRLLGLGQWEIVSRRLYGECRPIAGGCARG